MLRTVGQIKEAIAASTRFHPGGRNRSFDFFRPMKRDWPRRLPVFIRCPRFSFACPNRIALFAPGSGLRTVDGGSNVILSTSTASGKTLAFTLPVLHELATDPMRARCSFIR